MERQPPPSATGPLEAALVADHMRSVVEFLKRCPSSPPRHNRSLTRRRKTDGRLITKQCAAAHVGVSTLVFDRMVTQGVLPGPMPGSRKWDRKALDVHLDRASGLADPDDTYDAWRKNRCGSD